MPRGALLAYLKARAAEEEAADAQRSAEHLQLLIRLLQTWQQKHPDWLSPGAWARLLADVQASHGWTLEAHDAEVRSLYARLAMLFLKAVARGYVGHPLVHHWLAMRDSLQDPTGDIFRLHDPGLLSDDARVAAARRVAAHQPLPRRTSVPRQALSRLAAQGLASAEELYRGWLLTAGLWEATRTTFTPQPTPGKRRTTILPAELPLDDFVRRVLRSARREAEATLRQEFLIATPLRTTTDADQSTTIPRVILEEPETLAALASRHHQVFPSPDAMLEAQSLLAGLMEDAPPQQRRLLQLLAAEATPEEAAAELRIKRSTVDVLRHRLRKKRLCP